MERERENEENEGAGKETHTVSRGND